MSLDVYLTIEEPQSHKPNIYVRKDGRIEAISRDEYNEQFPGREPITCTPDDYTVYESNITHNLTVMAAEAGIHMYLWRPEEVGIEIAEQLINPLHQGLGLLESNPERFEELNPESG